MSWLERISVMSAGAVIVGLLVAAARPLPSADTLAPVREEERVGRTIRGLVPPLQVEGTPVVPRDVEEAMAESAIPALALAIVDDCEVVWAGGWGKAGDAGAPVSGRTPFQVGSVSKTVTAAVALTMLADGTLDLDLPVNELLRSWQLPANELTGKQPVLLRHLLSHSAGLTRTGYWLDRKEPMPDLAAILSGEHGNPAIEVEELPGSRAMPSNSGFLVLQALLEDVSGMSLAALAAERLFDPLRMTGSAFEPVAEDFLKLGATNHRRDGSAMDGKAPLIPGAPGGLWASAEDLARLTAELMKSWQGHSEAILPPDMARQMFTRQIGDMALGMHIRGEGEAFSVQQAGGGIGSLSHVIAYPDRCQGATIVVNTDNGRRVVAETLAAVGQEYDWPDLPLRVAGTTVASDRLARLVGRYEYDAAPGSSVTFSIGETGLHVQFGDRPPVSLISASDSVFVWPGNALEIRFDAPIGSNHSAGVTIGTAGLYGSRLSRAAPPDAESGNGAPGSASED